MMPAAHGFGSPTDAEATSDGSLIAIAKRIRTLLGGTGSIRLTDGTTTATIRDYASANPLDVVVNDTDGNPITSFGGGTQYTEGDTDASITGTAMLWEDGSDTLRPVSAAKPLPVDGSGVTQPVSHAALTELAAAIDTEVQVDVVGALPAGTNAIGKLAANSGVDIGDVDVTSITGVTMSNAAIQTTGDEAHDDADAGNPVKVGMKAIALGANPTAVAANDRTNWYANRHGVPWVMGGHPNIVTKNLNVTDADGAQTDTALVTVSAGTAIVVTLVQAMCDGANTGDVQCRIGFGTANTPAADAAGIILAHPGIKAGSGVVVGNGGGIVGQGASNEDLRLTCEDPAGGAIDITVTYFTIEI